MAAAAAVSSSASIHPQVASHDDSCTYYSHDQKDLEKTHTSYWYNTFYINGYTYKTVIITITPDVLAYLKSDTCNLPKETFTSAMIPRRPGFLRQKSSDSDFMSSNYSTSGTDEEKEIEKPKKCTMKKDKKKLLKPNTQDSQLKENKEETENNKKHKEIKSDIREETTERVDNRKELGHEKIIEGESMAKLQLDTNEEKETDRPEETDTKSNIDRKEEQKDSSGSEEPLSLELVVFEKFEKFDFIIDTAIARLGGSVFAKLGWKSPKDAVWIAFNKCLKCFMPGDIYILLKASGRISDVLNDPYKHCSYVRGQALPPSLILRTYVDINPAAEFRCFVVNHILVAICQRDVSACYPIIKECRDGIIGDIHQFFREYVHRFMDLTCYVFDIVRAGEHDVKLVDFNVFGLVTDSILFAYEELEKMYLDHVLVYNGCQVDPFVQNSVVSQGLPMAQVYGNPVFRFIEAPGRILAHPYVSSGAPQEISFHAKLMEHLKNSSPTK